MPKNYTSKTILENYILQTIDSTFDTQLNLWMESIEAFIDRQTGRNFKADSNETIKLYDGNGEFDILIDDFIVSTGHPELKIDDNVIATTDYYAYPPNTEKKNRIKFVNGFFTSGNQNVSVKAKWGYSAAVPADVQLAATILLAGVLNYSNKARVVRSETIGSYSVTYDTDKGWQDFNQAMKILGAYKKFTF